MLFIVGLTRNELGGSEYLALCHGLVSGEPPRVDLQQESALIKTLVAGIGGGLIHSAHDCAEGGLAVALAEACIAGGLGAGVLLQDEFRPDSLLFGESQGRAVISVAADDLPALFKLAEGAGIHARVIGAVRREPELVVRIQSLGVDPIFVLALSAMEAEWRYSIERLMA
jgi:phosphoribosylformylglycinamidine synthase